MSADGHRSAWQPHGPTVASASLATALVALLELLNRFVLRLVELYPDLLPAGTAWALCVSVSAVGQVHPRLRRWWIGVVVAGLGLVTFFGLRWSLTSDVFPAVDRNAIR